MNRAHSRYPAIGFGINGRRDGKDRRSGTGIGTGTGVDPARPHCGAC